MNTPGCIRRYGYVWCFLAILVLVNSGLVRAEQSSWRLIGPGDADQVTSLSVTKDGTVFLGTDIGGIYKSTNGGDTWKPMNIGLRNYDITTSIIENPGDPNTLYVGTRGGFYKSSNKGMLWTNKRRGLRAVANSVLSGSIGAVSVDPFSGRTLYLGYGYRQSADGTTVVQKIKWDQYIYKSLDSGESWKAAGKFQVATKVNQILPSALTRNLIFVATDDGLYKSVDGGNALSKIFSKRTLGILISRNDARSMLAACGVNGVYRSSDGGDTWTLSSTGLGFKTAVDFPDRYCVLAGPAATSMPVYAVNSTWGSYGGVYKSIDDGTTWQLATRSLPESWLRKSRRLNAIVVDPNDSNRVYIGSSRYVYRSVDAGKTWEQLISIATGSGWTNRGINVFGHTRFVVVNPSNTNSMFIGTTDHGMVRSDDGGASWNLSTSGMKYKDSVWDMGFCGHDSRRAYAISLNTASKFTVSRSDNGGLTWTSPTSNLNESNPAYKVLIHPTNCQTLYVASNNGVLKSTDGGARWTVLENGLAGTLVSSLAFQPSNPTVIYAGTRKGLFKSTNGGVEWHIFGVVGLPVTSVLVSNKNADIVFAGVEDSKAGKGGIYRTVNGGTTWTKVLTARRLISGIVQLSSRPDTIYAATNDDNFHDESTGSGVFVSRDHGNSWTSVNSGLSVLRAFNINVDVLDRVFLSANGSGAHILK